MDSCAWGSDGISVSVQYRGVNDLPGLAGPSLTCIAASYIGLSMAGLGALDYLCTHARTSAFRRGRASSHILICLTCLQNVTACCGC